MELSIVIPAYNEGHRIGGTIRTVRDFCGAALDRWEIVVVDDGSRDGTAAAADAASREVDARGTVRVLRNEPNRGKGYSVRRGILETTLDPVLFTDADLSTPIEEALRLLEAIREGADVAIASRRPSPATRVRRTLHRRVMATGFRCLVKAIALRGFHDTQCGFKMFRRDVARDLFTRQLLERWGFDVEVLYIARRRGYRIVEVPVSWVESPETRLRLSTPWSMALDLLRIRRNDLAGRYR